MDIHSLMYFQKVAELQHMTRAAQELCVAQPSLSRTISALEEELGVQLFTRVGKNIQLNPYGELLLQHANRILWELHDIEDEIAELKGEENRTVTVSFYAASKLLPHLVTGFKHEFPSIRLRIIQADLQREECDLTIFSSIQPCTGENETTLIEEEILLALPESNVLSRRGSIDLRDTKDAEFICLQQGKSLRTITDLYCQMAGFEPTVILESDSPETVREMIQAGIGISFVPSVTWSDMASESVAILPITFPQCKRYINLAWRKHGRLSPAALLFRDYVRRYFGALGEAAS